MVMPQLMPQRASSHHIGWFKLANTLQNNYMEKKKVIPLTLDTYSCCPPFGTSSELRGLAQHSAPISFAIHLQGTATPPWSTPRPDPTPPRPAALWHHRKEPHFYIGPDLQQPQPSTSSYPRISATVSAKAVSE